MDAYHNDSEELFRVELSDDDIYEAMKDISGYLDITPGDFKEVYKLAYRHAADRIAHAITAGDIMTRRVITTTKEVSLLQAAEIMAQNAISGIPVVDQDGTVAGMLTEKDFVIAMRIGSKKTFLSVITECLSSKGCLATIIHAKKVSDIMSSPVISVGKNTSILEITNIFRRRNINRVPVIDERRQLLGIVTRADMLRNWYCKINWAR